MRFMFKFLFVRMAEPTSPSWDCAADALPGQQDDWARERADAKSFAIWEWMRGRPPPRAERTMLRPLDQQRDCLSNLDGLLDMLRANDFLGTESEPQRLNAAFELGRLGSVAVTPLVEILRHESAAKKLWYEERGLHNPGQLFSRTALVAIGKPAVPALIKVLASNEEDWQVRAAAADALGDIGPESATVHNGAAVHALATVVASETRPWWVVRNAVEALGYLGAHSSEPQNECLGLASQL